ncbi:MAG: Kae1-associated serine/threonine protein kinase [Candidatus Aenigmarchaeota archaeon]|nr:Kae1-associated serine/threonine protein kinase [Candidatus Aenigmarchaeota archaeon]
MIIATGAEAILRKEDGKIIKERIKKNYRLNEIDEKLRTRRTKLEANLLREANRVGINVPRVFDSRKYEIDLEEVNGKLVKDVLNENNIQDIAEEIGRSLAKLHEYNIIHGDLTTSNMILSEGKIYFIDFGLGFNSLKLEDKAVDLYLLYHSVEATHRNLLNKFWEIILNSYKAHFKEADQVIKTLEQIEKRGRYKKRGPN